MGAFRLTRCYLAACIAVTCLVQTQRITPSAIAMPTSVGDALTEPWRLLAAFCYADGLTLGFALRIQAIACASYTLEHVCSCWPRAAAERSPIPIRGLPLYGACLAIGMGILAAVGLTRPAELGAPSELGAVAIFLLYVVCTLPQSTQVALGVPALPLGSLLPYGIVTGVACLYGAAASVHLCVGLGAGAFFECLDLLPSPALLASPADKAAAILRERSTAKAAELPAARQ